ncbi:MAG: hypothetical protein IT529_09020 [Burkholderiales bacterium]|nr:hypothetical protein [Burkholderiales bacterium]
MARILYAWELGGDFGHLAGFLPVARELARRGHAVDWVLRDLARVETALGGSGERVFQAPIWTTPVTGLPQPASFAETLFSFGYFDPAGLGGMLRGWRALYRALRPDLVVCDHAPTALVAARTLALPRITCGSPFGAPPRFDPLPAYRWWRPDPAARLVDSCNRVTAVLNLALQRIGAEPVASLAQALQASDDLLLSVPELDHYGARAGARYIGPLFGIAGGMAPRWPLAGERRVFAYVKPGYRDFEAMLRGLGESGASAVAYAPGASTATVRRFSNATLAISTEPVDMELARRDCDVGVCHAGMGTTAALLLAGKPVLMLPMQMEQLMLARRVESLGAGVVCTPGARPEPRRALARLLGERAPHDAARRFAERHAGLDPQAQAREAADRCEAQVGAAAP